MKIKQAKNQDEVRNKMNFLKALKRKGLFHIL